MNSPFLLVTYAAAIFSVATLAALAVLKALRTGVALRTVLFLALCYAVLSGTLWLSERWALDPVEIAYAWATALVVVAVVVTTRRWRYGRRIA